MARQGVRSSSRSALSSCSPEPMSDRPKARPSHSCSASASPSTPAAWPRSRTRPLSRSYVSPFAHHNIRNLTRSQTYTAKVASVLPALLSAIRVSPPSNGPAHDGKEIGKDVVTYEYKQVRHSSPNHVLERGHQTLVARPNPALPHRHRSGQLPLPRLPTSRGKGLVHRYLG